MDISSSDTADTPVLANSAPAKATPREASRETETAFVETAVAGEGSTHLARHALANYLEKNTDSSLTGEHKVYIEDYLRKHVAQKSVHPVIHRILKDLITRLLHNRKH
jgi:hypothetical protein